jgi:glycosyltransferase involved in cell wall biosynthesis
MERVEAGSSELNPGELLPSEGLRIAQVAPLYESVPPRLYGGTERVVAYLADALVDLGHEVTLFASGDSRTRATLHSGRERALRLDDSPFKSDIASHLAMLHEVATHAGDFDVVHFHTDLLHFPVFATHASRTVTTLHGRLDIADLAAVYRAWPAFPLVSISNDQRRPLPHAHWEATVHHGLPLVADVGTPPPGDYLAFVGRVAPEKRLDRAVRIARRAGLPLKVAAKVDPADARYFNDTIEPLIDEPQVEFLGEIGEREKLALLEGARALLFPIDWPEPFGLVMIEAMSRGTPVIAWRCGSVPEVIDDGKSGFIVDSEDAAVAACRRVETLDRAAIRRVFEARFSAPVMAKRYVEVYRAVLARHDGPSLRAHVGSS